MECGSVADLALKARPALSGVPTVGRHGRTDGPAGLVVRERIGLSLATVIARKGQLEALVTLTRSAYGLDLPLVPLRVSALLADARQIAFVWAGPAQWLAI